VDLGATVDQTPSVPRLVGRQKHRENHEAKTPEEYYLRVVAIPILDMITQNKDRFQEQQDVVRGGLLLPVIPVVFLKLIRN
jgi:hypothetical protein